MKITVKGAYGETNFGDDLLMVIFENYFLKNFPEAQLNFEGQNNHYVRKFLKKSAYNRRWKNPDWLVYGGGTQFFSFSAGKSEFINKVKAVLDNPEIIRNKFFPQKARHTAFLGIGLGPFAESRVIAGTQEKLRKASFMGVRDPVACKFCNNWGVEATDGADVAFSSYLEFPLMEQTAEENNEKEVKHVGIIVRDWNWDSEGAGYIEKIMDFYKTHPKSGFVFRFIILAPEKDRALVKLLKDEDPLIWNPDEFSINGFIEELNRFDILISARYHGAIIGALLGKRVVCIEVENKLNLLSQQIPGISLWKKPFGLDELYHHMQNTEKIDKSSLECLKLKADKMLHEFKKIV